MNFTESLCEKGWFRRLIEIGWSAPLDFGRVAHLGSAKRPACSKLAREQKRACKRPLPGSFISRESSSGRELSVMVSKILVVIAFACCLSVAEARAQSSVGRLGPAEDVPAAANGSAETKKST